MSFSLSFVCVRAARRVAHHRRVEKFGEGHVDVYIEAIFLDRKGPLGGVHLDWGAILPDDEHAYKGEGFVLRTMGR